MFDHVICAICLVLKDAELARITRRISKITYLLRTETVTDCCYVNMAD